MGTRFDEAFETLPDSDDVPTPVEEDSDGMPRPRPHKRKAPSCKKKESNKPKRKRRRTESDELDPKERKEIDDAIDQARYSAKRIFMETFQRKLLPHEEETAAAIDKVHDELDKLIRKGKTKYGINTDKDSLTKFTDVCLARKRKRIADEDDSKQEDDPEARKRKAWEANLVPHPTARGYAMCVDYREHATLPFLRPCVWVCEMTLDVDDYIPNIHCQMIHGYERAADGDLHNKVKGREKRFRSQTEQQKGLPVPRREQTWIEEAGDPTTAFEMLDLGTRRSCQSNKCMRDGMQWRRSDGVLDTVLILMKDALSVCKEGSYFYDTFLSGKASEEEADFLDLAGKRRALGGRPSDRTTQESVMRDQLRAIGKVGPAVSKAIYRQYKSMRALVHAYDACASDKERKELLADLCLESKSKGKSKGRRIGSDLSCRVFEFVYGQDG